MLYLVGTPIGNLGDLSPRAKEILSQVDLIACEDTRRTGLLLKEFGIEGSLISYHEHNKAGKGEVLINKLK
ncbi:MAG: 16S rRNA (cytidine(1402)-2'-O)-methyltransferase, partial [Clostridiales bacterium]|nr:16S rRNA (cytidine(1402)-2'-O)-methyltransferase [Clostridiales bacterium]